MECSFRLMVFSLFQEDLPFNTPWRTQQCVRRLCITGAPESLAFSLQSRAALCSRPGPRWLVWVSSCSFFLFLILFIYFKWRRITLQYCDGFAIHQHELCWCWRHTRVPSRLKPPPATPSLQAVSEPLLVSCVIHQTPLVFSHVAMYMFPCYSLKSPHPLPLPLSPKVCSLRDVSFELFL